MFRFQRVIPLLILLLFPLYLQAQIIAAAPSDFTLDDEVTITYNATLGNKALQGYKGPIYVYTGVVDKMGDENWKQVQGTLGKPDPRLRLETLANDQFQIKFRPRDFYDLSKEANPAALAFIFHAEGGKLQGKSAEGTAIYLPVTEAEKEITDFGRRLYQSHNMQGNQLVINTDNGKLLVQAYADGITRVSLSSALHQPNQNSYSVVLQPQQLQAQVIEQPRYLLYDTPETDVYISKDPLQLKFIQHGDTILAEEVGFYEAGERVGARFKVDAEEALYGTGSRAIPYNRRGRELKINNEAHYGYTLGEPVLNFTVPLLVSSEGYGVFFDNHYEGKIDAALKDPDVVDWRFKGGPASYYVITSKDYPQLLDRYTRLTGKQPLPPLWALGYIQSKYGYQTEAEAREIVGQLQQEQFPLDALVLDLYWFGEMGNMGRLDWDRTKWPTAEAMVEDLQQSGVKTILITEPYFTRQSENFEELVQKDLLVKNEAGNPYVIEDFWTGPAALIDITKPEAREWMWQFYKKHIDTGIAGWWSDLGEPENHPVGMRHQGGLKPYEVHNIYSLLWAKMLYEGYQREYPEQRPFNLIRSGYAGSQRYAVFPWSGDIERSWEGLQAQVPIMISMSMSGIGYMHSDLGGFTGGEKNPELYARWMQMGAFVPVMRAHGAGGVPPEPVFYEAPISNIVRNYIQLRYRLMPYLYTLAWRNTTEGMPLVLPMNFFDPDNSQLKDINDQYYWGENMLVAPVLQKGSKERAVVLPAGNWVDFWTGTSYKGLQTITVPTPLERLPLFVRSGSFLPMTNPRSSLQNYRTDTLQMHYFASGAPSISDYTLYLDDGKTTKANAYELLKFSALNKIGEPLQLVVAKEGSAYPDAPRERLIQWQVQGVAQAPDAVSWNGKKLQLVATQAQLKPGTAWYDNMAKQLQAWVQYTGGAGSLQVNGLKATPAVMGGASTLPQSKQSGPIATPGAGTALLLEAPAMEEEGRYKVAFEVPRKGDYTLEVRDSSGRTVFLQLYDELVPGRYVQAFQDKDSRMQKLPAGTYTLVLTGSADQKVIPWQYSGK